MITLIGLGPMGQAMARTLLSAGHQVTVWNRTASRADDLVTAGAARAESPAEALRASDLVILSLTDYQAMYDIIGDSIDVLSGKVIVNLSSDTPEKSREAAAWAQSHGAEFLTGGLMVPAPMVGTESAYAYYSGPKDVFARHESTLALIGAPRFVGEDYGLAQLYYQAQLDVFLTTLSSLLHATALVGAAGVSAASFLPDALETVAGIAVMIGSGDELGQMLDNGDHPGDLSTATMMGATASHILDASKAAGIDIELPMAIKSHYDRAIAAGHGKDNWSSLIEIMKNRG